MFVIYFALSRSYTAVEQTVFSLRIGIPNGQDGFLAA
jgi:hypothetical protein